MSKTITVRRKGEVQEVSRIQVGDSWSGKCWICKQACRLTRLPNEHDKYEAEQLAGQKGLFDE